MRPISFLDKDEIRVWGNEEIETLVAYYGTRQTHKYKDQVTTSEAILDGELAKVG